MSKNQNHLDPNLNLQQLHFKLFWENPQVLLKEINYDTQSFMYTIIHNIMWIIKEYPLLKID